MLATPQSSEKNSNTNENEVNIPTSNSYRNNRYSGRDSEQNLNEEYALPSPTLEQRGPVVNNPSNKPNILEHNEEGQEHEYYDSYKK